VERSSIARRLHFVPAYGRSKDLGTVIGPKSVVLEMRSSGARRFRQHPLADVAHKDVCVCNLGFVKKARLVDSSRLSKCPCALPRYCSFAVPKKTRPTCSIVRHAGMEISANEQAKAIRSSSCYTPHRSHGIRKRWTSSQQPRLIWKMAFACCFLPAWYTWHYSLVLRVPAMSHAGVRKPPYSCFEGRLLPDWSRRKSIAMGFHGVEWTGQERHVMACRVEA
jgi:hypothetical protein